MIIPDINLLIYAYNTNAPGHLQAGKWWKQAMERTETVGIPWVVSMGFVRLVTNPRVLAIPFTAEQALECVRSWFGRRQVQVLHPGPRHLEILGVFAEKGFLSSALTTDAHIAAIALEVRGVVSSNDSDFDRFPGIRRDNPLTDPKGK